MNIKTNTRRFLALVLTLALTFSLAAPALADEAAATPQPITEAERTAWRTLDIDEEADNIQALFDAMVAAAKDESVSDEDVIAAYDAASDAWDMLITYYVFAYWDYYRDSETYGEAFIALDTVKNTLYAAFYEAEQVTFAVRYDAFIEYLGKEEVEEELNADVSTEEQLEMMNREAMLLDDYYTEMAQDEVDYDAVAKIYIDLVNVRNELAQSYGYENYAEYAYYKEYGRDYTTEEAAALCEDVLEYIASVYSAMCSNETLSGIDTSYVERDRTQEELISAVEPYLGNISDELAYLFDYMVDNNLLDAEDLDTKLGGAFTYGIAAYNSAYICLSPGDLKINALVHEFGHFSRTCLFPYDDSNIDVAEIHSQGLEALYTAFAENMAGEGEEAAAYSYYSLDNLMNVVVRGAQYALFELEVYTADNLTVDSLKTMYGELLDMVDAEAGKPNWCDVKHFFNVPCYYVSYIISGMSALELLVMANEDFDAAREAYMNILTQPCDDGYSAAVTAAGLTDMLSDSAVEALAADLEDYIYNLEYDYMASQDLALTGTAEIGFADSDEDEYAVGTELEAAYTVEQEDAELAIQWYRDGVEIEDATEASYTLTPDDFGTTLSVAVSDADGAYFGALKDEVELAAIKPYITASTSVSSGKITVTFSAEGCGSEVTSYTVKIEYDGVESKSKTFSEAGSYTFTGLLSDLEYDVIISAKNSVGTSTKELSVTPKSSNAGGSGGGATSIISSIFSGTTTTTSSNPFTDVDDDSYYYDAVLWAVENDITSGTTASTFSPEDTCTRAQAVTFLWRAAGSPSVNGENSFGDVSEDDYYYTAVLWALQNGITTGTSDTAFSPNGTCTRAEIVTFLYRYSGKTAAAGSDFADVNADAWYASAVSWAVDGEITNGTGENTFSPNDDCTRAQIVTFLYRAES